MGARTGNKNARRGKHERVLVPISGKMLDALYVSLNARDQENDPHAIKMLVHDLIKEGLNNQKYSRCSTSDRCPNFAELIDTNDMVWLEDSNHFGFYCKSCYEKKVEKAATPIKRKTRLLPIPPPKELLTPLNWWEDRGERTAKFDKGEINHS